MASLLWPCRRASVNETCTSEPTPEQLEGTEADARTDLFSFGAVAYEMVTGRKAFEGKSQASLITSIMSTEPPLMTTVQPLAPPVFERMIRKCLAKDPDDRWQSARDLASELKWVAGGVASNSAANAVAVTSAQAGRSARRERVWMAGSPGHPQKLQTLCLSRNVLLTFALLSTISSGTRG